MSSFPSPTEPREDRRAVLLGYVDYFRSVVLDRLSSVDQTTARTARVPSGWTPAELAWHLLHVERRWLEWGFEGAPLDDPWADHRDGRWHLPADVDVSGLTVALRERGEVTRAIVGRHELDEVGRPGPRWDGAEPATLERVLLHLVQEYARHAGHLDVVVELAGGATGE